MINSNVINTNPIGILTNVQIPVTLTQRKVVASITEIIPVTTPVGPIYDADAQALFNRMTVQPSTGLKELIEKTIVDLRTAGIWQITDKFHKWDLHTEQASLLDWKNSAFDSEVSGTNVGFTPASGVLTSSTGHIELNFTPSTDCTYASLNDFAFSLDDIGDIVSQSTNFGAYNTSGNSYLLFRTKESVVTPRPWLYLNSVAQRVWNNNAGINLYYNVRPNSSTITIYKAPTIGISSVPNYSVAMIDQSLVLGGTRVANGNVSRWNINTSTFWLGSQFTSDQRTAWYSITDYWKSNIAAAI